ncbi:hypothetical protein LI283_14470, partial [Anaerostipes hadrus]|nr:hypothetical protein [Anaerostipes hadrus]
MIQDTFELCTTNFEVRHPLAISNYPVGYYLRLSLIFRAELSPYDRQILDQHVRYVGDPVAIVA